ncbi:hypothetical protein [Deinococcus soli (ex Cha et al. 2016)]|uniref:Uncharacterized protein n=2 Tax=Deinococcus soli (ex Cha et al. 2016) TaxID=1309411 RepID=A0AAE3XDJ7_9DEIO|nr:hypothetical protein [Deinococcus soli (ex Cha et al. 2016)]MDR6218679.1 hypothetical protein [Deinococcus soli (ex Cha et al. 2016)]MDR6328476.1 hypothetical protein [Deinococcus soli (ex Cha et al. 2016)]MDR6753087.1 hypothetical protein [Deinococcus soli (ex Cha et al. 2016)]
MRAARQLEVLSLGFTVMFAVLTLGRSLMPEEPAVDRSALWAEVTRAPNLAPQRLTVTLTGGERVTFDAPAGAGACLMVMVWKRNSHPESSAAWPVALRTARHPQGIDARDIQAVSFTRDEPTEAQMIAARDSGRCPGMTYR